MSKLSIVIPSNNERFLKRTIEDVLEKATGNIEIFPILDGYMPPEDEIIKDSRVKYIHFITNLGKRPGINAMVAVCTGDYVMSLDAHCMMAKGFDEQLIKDHQPNWVQVPRRKRLDPIKWSTEQGPNDTRPPIDYEYIMYPPRFNPMGLTSFRWDTRTYAREHIKIDDICGFQGSCWFMTKEWFNKCGFMDVAYQTWGQEAQEILFETLSRGGRVVVNKNTWYAHLHKGKKYGRMYHLSNRMRHASASYCWYKWWRSQVLDELIDRFMPLPNWPANWREHTEKGNPPRIYEGVNYP